MSFEQKGSLLRALVGSELSSVIFVQDYLQLVFQPITLRELDPRVLLPPRAGAFGTLSAFTLPMLQIDGRNIQPGQPGYRDALVEQIGRRVTDTDEHEESIHLEFESGCLASLSLSQDDLDGEYSERFRCVRIAARLADEDSHPDSELFLVGHGISRQLATFAIFNTREAAFRASGDIRRQPGYVSANVTPACCEGIPAQARSATPGLQPRS